MPRVEVSVELPVALDAAFAVSQSQGDVRYAWDPFVIEQRLLHGAIRPDKGVQTFTRSRHRLVMVSEYTSFRPPNQVGMKMVKGPWFFSSFGGGWSFRALDGDIEPGGDGHRTEATWRYTFSVRPGVLASVANPIGVRLLTRDIQQRIDGFARACSDEELVERAMAQLHGS